MPPWQEWPAFSELTYLNTGRLLPVFTFMQHSTARGEGQTLSLNIYRTSVVILLGAVKATWKLREIQYLFSDPKIHMCFLYIQPWSVFPLFFHAVSWVFRLPVSTGPQTKSGFGFPVPFSHHEQSWGGALEEAGPKIHPVSAVVLNVPAPCN